jgi:cytochrome c1
MHRRLKHPMAVQWLLLVGALALAACAPGAAGQGMAQGGESRQSEYVAGGDPRRGAAAIRAYGCDSCHKIPGIVTANALVGPPLDQWADRHYIAGKLPNEPQFLIQWIRYPQAIEPGTAMPNLGVTEQDARDIGAYLYTLRRD